MFGYYVCRHVFVNADQHRLESCLYCGLRHREYQERLPALLSEQATRGGEYNNEGDDECDGQPAFQHPAESLSWCRPYDVEIREHLLDALAPMHMDTGILVDRTVAELYKIALDGKSKATDRFLQLSMRKRADRGKLAFVLWDTLVSEGCPRDPKEIAIIMETTTAYMRQTEKALRRQPSHSPLENYVPRIGAELGVPHWAIELVKKASWHECHRMNKPEDLVGALFVMLGEAARPNGPVGVRGHLLTPAGIGKALDCTPRRLARLRSSLSPSTARCILDGVAKKIRKTGGTHCLTELSLDTVTKMRSRV